MRSNGIKSTKSATFVTASNGQVERFILLFKHSMKAMKWEAGNINKDSEFLLTNASNTDETPSKLFLGRVLTTRLHFLKPNIKNFFQSNQEKSCKIRHERKERQFGVGDKVIAKDYRGQDPWVPGVITEK